MSETTPENVDTPAQDDDARREPEIDWRSKSREWERRAKENKAAADKLAQLEESQRTEAEKQAARIAEAERKAADADYKLAVADIAAKHSLPAAIVAGPTERTAEAVEDYVKQLNEWAGLTKKRGNYVPTEGRQPMTNASPDLTFARQIFGSNSDS